MRRKRAPAKPQDWLTRLDEVRENGDRRASKTLLLALLDPDTDDDLRTEVAAALRALEDPRCAEPLRRAVLDASGPVLSRSLALEVHAAIPVDAAPRAEARACARSPDPVVRAFGVRTLDVPDSDALVTAACDPAPLVRYAAVDAIASIARTPPLVEATRRALVDEDAAVREAACRVALFDEPLDATHELLRALSDSCTAVRVAACDALEDFPRVSVVLALAEARGETESGVAAKMAFDGVVRRIRTALAQARPRARRRIERWAEPVRWLLEGGKRTELDDILDACEHDEAEDEYEPVSVPDAARVLLDPDAPPQVQRRMLVFHDWSRAGEAGLAVARACAASPNWSLRQGAAFALAEMRATADLVALATDREPVVRRAAFEGLLRLGDPRGIAPAKAALADAAMRPIAGDDALALVATLADRADAEHAVVAELERPDDRDGMWLGAIQLTRRMRLAAARPHLARIAASPVTSSVLPHVAALSALRRLGAPRPSVPLGHLEATDHLEVERELGEWGWHGARYG